MVGLGDMMDWFIVDWFMLLIVIIGIGNQIFNHQPPLKSRHYDKEKKCFLLLMKIRKNNSSFKTQSGFM